MQETKNSLRYFHKMVVEIKGNQLRIRVASPKNFKRFSTIDPGKKGRLQIVIGITPNNKSKTQSFRLNLKDFQTLESLMQTISNLKILKKLKNKAIRKAKLFFKLRPTSMTINHAHQWSPRMQFASFRNGHRHKVNLKKKVALANKKVKHTHRLL